LKPDAAQMNLLRERRDALVRLRNDAMARGETELARMYGSSVFRLSQDILTILAVAIVRQGGAQSE
jgi:hypothetical protein